MNYIGSKHRLLGVIEGLLDAAGVPPNGVALDLFAGTGAVARRFKARGHTVYANDWQRYAYCTLVARVGISEWLPFAGLVSPAPSVARVSASGFLPHGSWLLTPEPDLAARDSGPGARAIDSAAIGASAAALTARRSPAGVSPAMPTDAQAGARHVLDFLAALPGLTGSFFETYCEGGAGGRCYFSRANGLRIQAIRDRIEAWWRAQVITDPERDWLVACLLEAADGVANTASVYGAHLKQLKATALRPLSLRALDPAPGTGRVFCEDGAALVSRLTEPLRLVYLDPPYNVRQYSANYHILETLARWDLNQFVPRGATGLRPEHELRSEFCRRSTVRAAFRRLLSELRAEWLLFSYNDEGLIGRDELVALIEEQCDGVRVIEQQYPRFRADLDHSRRVYRRDATVEYLILGRPRL